MKNKQSFKDKNVVIAGGGDSALDWSLDLLNITKKLTLIHRRDQFKASPASVNKMHESVKNKKMDFKIAQLTALNGQNGYLKSLSLKDADNEIFNLDCDCLLAFYGLSMNTKSAQGFNLKLINNLIEVNTENFETNVSQVFSIGDVNYYKGKLKLILSGFHEAALMAQKAFIYCRPTSRLRFQYTTSSTSLKQKLGVIKTPEID